MDLTLPGASLLYNDVAANASPSQTRLHKHQSQGSLLNPLLRLLREPTNLPTGAKDTISAVHASTTSETACRKQVLRLRLRQAESYSDWLSAASELDRLENNDAWKLEEESAEYDTVLVRARLKELEDARISCDANRMLFLIRTSLTRGLGGMGDLRLYKHSRVGTKALIERYIESALATLDALIDASSTTREGVPDPRAVMEQLLQARQAFGRSALLLSGGGTLGMNHIGVVKTLFEANLLPRIISGASAGSIVCAVLCTKTDDEIPAVLQDFCYGDLAVFEREGDEEGILKKATRFLKHGALFDISNLVRVMKDLLGDITFQEAYNRTRRILNICVSTASLYELPRLLNYVTAPNVIIWSAVAASCSVPFVFSAAELLAKDPKTGNVAPWNQSAGRWIDGSVDNDLPMTRLAEMFNVNHFIVSQVNPHVVPFLAKEEEEIKEEAQQSGPAYAAGPAWLHTMASLAKSEALHRMHVLSEMGVMPNALSKIRSVLGQRYAGDITIFPEVSYAHFPRVLANPTTEFMVQAMLCGERATWPKLSRIRNHCAIELALDNAVQQLRARVVFSPSQIDLRLNTFGRATRSERGRRRRTSSDRHAGERRSVESLQLPVTQALRPQTHVSFPLELIIPASASTKIAGPSADYTSSGQDTTVSSSAAEAEDSDALSSDSSFGSPPSPHPLLWPSTRQLFPSASQPVSPSIASKTFLSPSASAATLSMTPAPMIREPSTPELRYKRLFHSADVGKGNAQAAVLSPSSTQRARQERVGDLRIDISGTRGMVRRKKRSLSTGLKGLWPPGEQ